MRGRLRSLLDEKIKSGFDEGVEELPTAEGDPNDVLDEFAPSDIDSRVHGRVFAHRTKPKLVGVRADRLALRPRPNDLRADLQPAQRLRPRRAGLWMRAGRARLRLCSRSGLWMRAGGNVSHLLPTRAHGGLHAGSRGRPVQRLRVDNLSSNAGMDLSGLAAALFALSSGLRPCGERRRVCRLWWMFVVQFALRRMLFLRLAVWWMFVVRLALRRLLLLQYRSTQRLRRRGRLLFLRSGCGPAFDRALARSRRNESAALNLSAHACTDRARDDWRPDDRTGCPRFCGAARPDLCPGHQWRPDLSQRARCWTFVLRR